MKDFLQRFGQQSGGGEYKFSNVRSGLIVGLVCFLSLQYLRSLYTNPI